MTQPLFFPCLLPLSPLPLRYRYDQLGQDCIRTRTEVSAFQHNSQAYARTIAQLRRIQSKIDAQALTITAQYADKLKEVTHTPPD